MLTADPPARIAAILEPVRALADEVVIAADSRVSADTLAAYAALADAVHAVEFLTVERHVPWLHAQCAGDWILRLDGDEVPSAALAARLPELMASRTVATYAIARAWCFPDAGHVLDESPWSTDFQTRLVRNGAQSASRAYVAEPIYHIDLLASDEQERRAKAIRNEVVRPHVVAAGGGRLGEAFYLPELRPDLRTRELPPADAAVVARALDPGARRTCRLGAHQGRAPFRWPSSTASGRSERCPRPPIARPWSRTPNHRACSPASRRRCSST